jgi:hypothetical protein
MISCAQFAGLSQDADAAFVNGGLETAAPWLF